MPGATAMTNWPLAPASPWAAIDPSARASSMWAGPGRGAQADRRDLSTGQVGLNATLPRTDDPGGGMVDGGVVDTVVAAGARCP